MKGFECIIQPDTRGVALFDTIDLQNWHKYVANSLKVKEYSPENIKVQIETIKNIFLYSWFVYRFGVVAFTQVHNVLELALKLEFKEYNLQEQQGLRSKLEKAYAEKWFNASSFSDGKNNTDIFLIIDGIVGMRNSLHHGSTFLYDPLTLINHLEVCVEIINALFSND